MVAFYVGNLCPTGPVQGDYLYLALQHPLHAGSVGRCANAFELPWLPDHFILDESPLQCEHDQTLVQGQAHIGGPRS